MRWAFLLLVGCGRIAFDPFGSAAGDAAPACTPDAALAATHVVNPGDDLYGLLGTLVPGDVVVVHAGTYSHASFFSATLNGTAAQPIIIEGAPGERPILSSDPSTNVLELGGSYFTLRGFSITGGSTGIRVHTSSHATFDDLVFTGIANNAVSCNFTGQSCDALVLRRLDVAGGAGAAINLGNFDLSQTASGTLVEGCYIHDRTGGIALAPGSSGVTVRDNVIARVQTAAIVLRGFTGAGPDHLVERNLVWGVSADNGIQVEGHVLVRNNIVLDTNPFGIASFQLDTPTDRAKIVHNTVWCGMATTASYSENWDTSSGQVLENNALYCPGGAAITIVNGAPAAVFVNNVIVGTSDTSLGTLPGASVAADLGDPTTAHVFPPLGSALIDAGEASSVTDDFDGNPRDSTPDVGAYERGTATAPAWTPVSGFKPLPASGCP